MSRFDHYFQMNVDDVIEYTLEKAGEIPWDRDSMEAVVPPWQLKLCVPGLGRQRPFHLYQAGRDRGQDFKGYEALQGPQPPGIRNPYAGGPVRARHGAPCVLF